MNQRLFDQIAVAVAGDASRRGLMRGTLGGGAAALLSALGIGSMRVDEAKAATSCAKKCKNKNSKKKRRRCRKRCRKKRGPACRSQEDCGNGFQCIGEGNNRSCCSNDNLCGPDDAPICCPSDRCIEQTACCPEGFIGCGLSCCDTAITTCTRQDVGDFCCLKDFVCGTGEDAVCCIDGTCDNGVCTQN